MQTAMDFQYNLHFSPVLQGHPRELRSELCTRCPRAEVAIFEGSEVSEGSWLIAVAFSSVRNVEAVMKASLFSVYQLL